MYILICAIINGNFAFIIKTLTSLQVLIIIYSFNIIIKFYIVFDLSFYRHEADFTKHKVSKQAFTNQ